MKFRGIIHDTVPLKEFYNISFTLSKLSKECVLRITLTKLYFIMYDETHSMNKPVVWCELIANCFFNEFSMEGVSTEHNEIYLEFSPALLTKSLIFLKSGAQSLKIKLANKSAPCLTVEIECPKGNQSQHCVHDIPVKMISRKLWHEFQEPEDLNYNITIQMPSIKSLRSVIETLKSLSQHLVITASQDGRFSLSTGTTLGSITAHATNVEVHSFSGHQTDDYEESNDSQIRVQIDIRKFHSYLVSQQISYKIHYCSIVNEELMKIYLQNDNGVSMKYFLSQFNE